MVQIKQRFDNDDHYKGGNTKEYIVIHDTGNYTDSDEGNANYFCTGSRNSSAHYFVDDDSITQIVRDEDCSWHCGDGNMVYGIGNRNSIGIEQCRVKGRVTSKTINNTIELVKSLMKKYNVPVSKVVRHYDASRKNCPASFNLDGKWTLWHSFKNQLSDTSAPVKKVSSVPVSNVPIYTTKYLQRQIGVVVDGIAGVKTLGSCPLLKVGSTGNVVRFLQSKVGAVVDGIFGYETKASVIRFQINSGLLVDGIVGKNTWRKLLGL